MSAAAFACGLTGAARADVFIANGYHAQQTPFYCGPGSMEMILDSPVVAATNATVAGQVAAANANNLPTQGVGENFQPVNVNPGDLVLQTALYQAEWGAFSGIAFATGRGSPPSLVTGVMNAADGPARNGGIRAYANYNFAPVLIAGDLASRTVAAALQNFQVPAMVAVETGAHWINVNGVSTNGVPAQNGAYTINGFFVRDPWTGLAINNLATNPGLAAAGGFGLGSQAYLRYGADILPGGGLRLAPWFQYFNPTSPRSSPANAYTIVVDPLAPEPADTFDPNATVSDPSGIPMATETGLISKSTALTDALGDLSGDTDSLDDVLSGGSLDTNATDETAFQFPGDTSGQGDWLIPYDSAGSGCDVSGAMLIDQETGLVDMASVLPSAVCLPTLQQMFTDLADGILPNDNGDILPEPGTAAILVTSIAGLRFVRRRRRAPI